MFAPALFQEYSKGAIKHKTINLIFVLHVKSTFKPESIATIITITLNKGSYMCYPMDFRNFQLTNRIMHHLKVLLFLFGSFLK